LIGADGAKHGSWLVVTKAEGGKPRLTHLASTAELFATVRRLKPLAVVLDVPIGLPESGSRSCDLEARRLLRPRGACVFPAPPRGLLGASSQSEASRIWRGLDGRGCPAQTYNLLDRISEVDQELQEVEAELVEKVHEGHPELSFLEMADGAMLASKHSPEGTARRLELLALDFPDARAWSRARWGLRLDVLDACACLWTAGRLANGAAKKVPAGKVERDGRGLPMRICF
jgi:predicted RNase H-like nuclease